MNPSESATAAVLDRMRVRWEYEPHEFVLRTSEHGTAEAFRPDFWIPDHGLYVEVTMAKTSNLSRKHRKAAAARLLHGIRVELLYRRDFLSGGGPAERLEEILASTIAA